MLMFAFGIEHEIALLRPDGHRLDDAIEMRKNEVYYSGDDQRGVRMERNGYAARITHLSF
jgi:hypothetical protein